MCFLDLLKIANTGKDCWNPCGYKQGPCKWCGYEGWCCTKKSGFTDTSNGCDGTFGGLSMHECALKPSKFYVKILLIATNGKHFETYKY